MATKNEENPHIEHRKRLKKQFALDDGKTLSDFTFLEYLLFFSIPQGDTNPIAHRLIKKFGSFDRVLEASREELTEVDGVGEHTAMLLSSLMPTFSRYLERKSSDRFEYTDRERVCLFVKSKYLGLTEESVMLMHFDSKGIFTNYVFLSAGALNKVALNKRELAASVVRDKAVFSILVHNHPSGIASPSTEDLYCVQGISAFLKMLSVTLVDNIIVTNDNILSFSESKRYVRYLY